MISFTSSSADIAASLLVFSEMCSNPKISRGRANGTGGSADGTRGAGDGLS
jgi:hypothetical protein